MDPTMLQIPKDPYLDYNAQAARTALACVDCPPPAPCVSGCPQGADVPGVMALVRRAACERLPLARWLLDEEGLATAQIADQIYDCYN